MNDHCRHDRVCLHPSFVLVMAELPSSEQEETSPRSHRGSIVNDLTMEQLTVIINTMKTKTYTRGGVRQPYLEQTPTGHWRCTLACTVDARGNPKYPQLDISYIKPGAGKQLVHLVYWRYQTRGQLIDPSLYISHRDADSTVLNLVQESREMNESRKYCHLFGWYKTKPGEDRPRCPHWENPCTGQ